MFASSVNKHFFTKQCHCQTYQNYEQPPQSQFLVLKIGWSFPIFFSVKNIELGGQLLFKYLFDHLGFKVPYFQKKKTLIFVGSFHNFGRSDSDIIQSRNEIRRTFMTSQLLRFRCLFLSSQQQRKTLKTEQLWHH